MRSVRSSRLLPTPPPSCAALPAAECLLPDVTVIIAIISTTFLPRLPRINCPCRRMGDHHTPWANDFAQTVRVLPDDAPGTEVNDGKAIEILTPFALSSRYISVAPHPLTVFRLPCPAFLSFSPTGARAVLLAALRGAEKRVGKDPGCNATHSLRLGGAAAMWHDSADQQSMRKFGRWTPH